LPFRDLETYSFSYSIIAELRDRYGDVFFQRFFRRLHEMTMAGQRLRERSDEEIILLMSEAAQEDLRPFFVGELGFGLEAESATAPNTGPTPGAPPLE